MLLAILMIKYNFLHKLLLTNIQVLKVGKAFAIIYNSIA